MTKMLSVLFLVRARRVKVLVKNKPLLALGLLFAVGSFFFGVIKFQTGTIPIVDLPGANVITVCGMAYLVGKIINPTQGMTADYQLLQMKLISFRCFKCIMAMKLLWAGMALLVIGGAYGSELLMIIGALNMLVNNWIFLRNRWNNRIVDFIISVLVILSLRYRLTILGFVVALFSVVVYVMLSHVNYSELLPLYKLIYQIGQQRYLGMHYSEKDCRDIQTNAEKLVGKPKTKSALWCENSYDNTGLFFIKKEIARVHAKGNSLLAYLIICILLGMVASYLPAMYQYYFFPVLVFIAWSYCVSMNRGEKQLLMRGFISQYHLKEIMMYKASIYAAVTWIMLLPSALWGVVWIWIALVSAVLLSIGVIYKCFAKV
ncbi:MAG: hypothetical protein ACI4E2_11615 [Acetatifactor sp.]